MSSENAGKPLNRFGKNMLHKKTVFLMALAFLAGWWWNAPSTEFWADPMPAYYMGHDAEQKAFIFNVHKYGVEHIPYEDLHINGDNAWLYDAVFQLNKYETMASPNAERQQWKIYVSHNKKLCNLNDLLGELIGNKVVREEP